MWTALIVLSILGWNVAPALPLLLYAFFATYLTAKAMKYYSPNHASNKFITEWVDIIDGFLERRIAKKEAEKLNSLQLDADESAADILLTADSKYWTRSFERNLRELMADYEQETMSSSYSDTASSDLGRSSSASRRSSHSSSTNNSMASFLSGYFGSNSSTSTSSSEKEYITNLQQAIALIKEYRSSTVTAIPGRMNLIEAIKLANKVFAVFQIANVYLLPTSEWRTMAESLKQYILRRNGAYITEEQFVEWFVWFSGEIVFNQSQYSDSVGDGGSTQLQSTSSYQDLFQQTDIHESEFESNQNIDLDDQSDDLEEPIVIENSSTIVAKAMAMFSLLDVLAEGWVNESAANTLIQYTFDIIKIPHSSQLRRKARNRLLDVSRQRSDGMLDKSSFSQWVHALLVELSHAQPKPGDGKVNAAFGLDVAPQHHHAHLEPTITESRNSRLAIEFISKTSPLTPDSKPSVDSHQTPSQSTIKVIRLGRRGDTPISSTLVPVTPVAKTLLESRLSNSAQHRFFEQSPLSTTKVIRLGRRGDTPISSTLVPVTPVAKTLLESRLSNSAQHRFFEQSPLSTTKVIRLGRRGDTPISSTLVPVASVNDDDVGSPAPGNRVLAIVSPSLSSPPVSMLKPSRLHSTDYATESEFGDVESDESVSRLQRRLQPLQYKHRDRHVEATSSALAASPSSPSVLDFFTDAHFLVAFSCQEALPWAQAEFHRLDLDHDGWIDGPEVKQLTDWTFANYHPRGVRLSLDRQRTAVRLLNTVVRVTARQQLSLEQYCVWLQGL